MFYKSLNTKYITLSVIVSLVQGQIDDDYQIRPDRCQAPIELMYRQCCIFPPFFTRTIARSCGGIADMNFVKNDIGGFVRKAVTGCDHWRCILKKYNFLTPNGLLDDDKYYAHLDKWTELNSAFKTVILNAKVHCKLNYQHLFPMEPCEFYNLHGCIRNFVNLGCPVYMPTKECQEVKEFNDECRDFFT